MSGDIDTIQIDGSGRGSVRFVEPTARFGAGSVVARAGNRYRSRSSTGPGNGPARASSIEGSPSNTFAGVASPLTTAIARGRMGSPARVPAARTQLHVDDLLGHDATCMGAGKKLLGLPLIFDRADDVRQHAAPVLNTTHHQYAHIARPACHDGVNMRQSDARHTQIGEA